MAAGRRNVLILAGLLALILLVACGMLQTSVPNIGDILGASTSEGPSVAGTSAGPPLESTQTALPEEPVQPTVTGPLPSASPTPPPPMEVWPLAADLYYLNDVGQVWRQPMLGDHTVAAAVTRLDLIVRDFDVAPGGNWLIYRTDSYVGTTSLDGRQGQVIANVGLPLDTTRGRTVAWSPDGAKLAFISTDGFQVMIPGAGENYEPLVYAVAEQTLASLSWSGDSQWLLVWRTDNTSALYSTEPLVKWVELGLINDHAWLADGRLAFAPAEGGLALLRPGDVTSRVFVVPQDRQVTRPVQRPDGTLAFFAHTGSVAEPGFLYVADPDDLSFRVESAVPVETEDMMWDPTGTRLIERDPLMPATALLLDPSTGSQATLETVGTPLRFDWGDLPPHGVAGLILPANLYFLAPQAGIVQVWRLPADGDPPEAITSAASDVVAFDISQDGRQVVYTSAGVIYHMQIGSAEASEVATLSSAAQSGTPALSPSGGQIAYADGGIRVYDLETDEIRRLIADIVSGSGSSRLVEVYDQPLWSPDGSWLLIRVSFYEGYDYALLSTVEPDAGPTLLNMINARAEWADDLTAYVYYEGGAYGAPYFNRVQPGSPLSIARLVGFPVIDVETREDGRLALLRVPLPGTGGPTGVRVYSIQPNGTNLLAETRTFVLEGAILSPGAGFIAGLVQVCVDEDGVLSGRLAIVDIRSEQVFLIESTSGVRELRWGR